MGALQCGLLAGFASGVVNIADGSLAVAAVCGAIFVESVQVNGTFLDTRCAHGAEVVCGFESTFPGVAVDIGDAFPRGGLQEDIE